MTIAIIGKGNVGTALGDGWTATGHNVVYGVKTPSEPDESTVADAVAGADIVALAVPWPAVGSDLLGGADTRGKIILDCTNPIRADFSGLESLAAGSAGETVAQLFPEAHAVKAFNTVGFNIMRDPGFDAVQASMLVAGDDAGAKATVMGLASDLGFTPEDAGPITQSGLLEHFAWLWITMALKFGHSREMAFVLHKR